MNFTELHTGIVAPDPPQPLPEAYAIAGELAARVLEYMEQHGDEHLTSLLRDLFGIANGFGASKATPEMVDLIREHQNTAPTKTTAPLLNRLSLCHRASRLAGHWVLHALTGNLDHIVEPFSAQGKDSDFTKQAAHKEYLVAMDALADYFPEVAECLQELRAARSYPAPYPITTQDPACYSPTRND